MKKIVRYLVLPLLILPLSACSSGTPEKERKEVTRYVFNGGFEAQI